jgi:hypothetical protein
MVRLIQGVLQMSNHQTLKDLPSVISSQESEDGVEHCNSQDGVQADLFGQEALHANHSARQEAEKERMTSDTSGPSSLISSESANLQQSLVSRLQQLSDLGGSMIYKTTLKEKVTPQQRLYYHLAASARTTKGTDSSSLQSAWPTPTHHNSKEGGYPGELTRNTIPLGAMKHMVAWATPNTMDYMAQRSDEALSRAKTKGGCSNLKDQIPISGTTHKSSIAETENIAPSQLNPRFSLWLMGYPIEWAYSGEAVTPLSRKRQRK